MISDADLFSMKMMTTGLPATTSCCWALRPTFAVQPERSPLSKPSAKRADAAAGATVVRAVRTDTDTARAAAARPFRLLLPGDTSRSRLCTRPRSATMPYPDPSDEPPEGPRALSEDYHFPVVRGLKT